MAGGLDWLRRMQAEAEGATPLALSAYQPPTVPTGAPTPVVLDQAQRGVQSLLAAAGDAATVPRDAWQGKLQTQPSAMTDAEIGRVNNLAGMVGSGGFAMAKPEGSLGMFAGRQSKTADQIGLLSAAVGEHAGHSADNIYKNTGWYRGADRNWKYEIPDNNAVLDLSGVKDVPINSSARVRDILKHDELFAAYPDLADVPIRNISATNSAWMGQTREGRELMGLNLQNPNEEWTKSTLLHELQHAIQNREGFGKGANPNMPEITSAKPIADAQARIDRLKADGKEFHQTTRTLQNHLDRDKWMPYSRAAGEVEARAVQDRMHYTPEQRMQMTPLAWESQQGTGLYRVPAEQQWLPGKTRPFLDEYYGAQ